ncbi:hypothetical protein Mapa_010282 [Marchantia paleacea]|nr:hypothetical protein Mapa_010282 [Marchantia paleacea]
MGLLFFIPLLTFIGLKVSHYIFLATVQSFVAFFTTYLWVDRSTSSTSSSSSSPAKMATSSGSSGSSGGGPPSPSASRSLVQYLNQILSMRGPNQLPYDEEVKWAIRQNLLAVIKDYAGLQVKTGSFTHNDGRTTNLLQVYGTIPMFFKEVKYNIPVTMWLLEAFPRVGPMVFVTPTQDMVIKHQHRFVDASGTVTIPYLSQWIYPRSNLVELVQNLSEVFGLDPPLYSRPPVAATTHVHRVPNSSSSSHSPRASSIHHGTNPMNSSSNLGPGSPRPQSPSAASFHGLHRLQSLNPPYTVSPASSPRPGSQVKSENPVEVFRHNAVNALSERLHRDMNTMVRRANADMDELFNTQVILNERIEIVDQGFHEMQREKELLEEELQLYMTNTVEIESWLRHNDGDRSELDIDRVFEPCDALSNQLLENTAADLAIEDILYSLDRAVQEGVIPWDNYYKTVRSLSREQFYLRATCAKVKAAQRHHQVEGMAFRASMMSVS